MVNLRRKRVGKKSLSGYKFEKCVSEEEGEYLQKRYPPFSSRHVVSGRKVIDTPHHKGKGGGRESLPLLEQ